VDQKHERTSYTGQEQDRWACSYSFLFVTLMVQRVLWVPRGGLGVENTFMGKYHGGD